MHGTPRSNGNGAEHVLETARLGARLELLRSFVRDDTALGDDDGARANRIHLFEDMCRDHDDLVAADRVDETAHFVFLVWVEAIRRLIENHDRRVVDYRLGKPDAAAKAFG